MWVPELLAPAGSLEKLKVAISYGADAVYLAGQQFGLRGAADNFTQIELEEAVDFAHQRGSQVYVVLNAFLHDEDLDKLPPFAKFLESIKVDAVIVSDLGVVKTIQKHSQIPIHISTQASCLNIPSAQVWKSMGAQRLILGREVSVKDAGQIKKEVGIEIELFIHGAMCMAYSGNCTISNYTAGRDSNRGGCVQSCRFHYEMRDNLDDPEPYEKTSFMSSKDLRGLELLPQFIDNEIDSIKIEGRMKSNLYAATTVQAYSKALQICQSVNAPNQLQQELRSLSEELEKVRHRDYTAASLEAPAAASSIYRGDRSGFSTGNYEIAGTVIEVCEDAIILQVQNPLENNEKLEILTFDGQIVHLPTEGMMDLYREPIARANPNSLIALPFVQNIDKLNLARKKAA